MATIALRAERFEGLLEERGIGSNTAAGQFMGIHDAQISRVRHGRGEPGTKFIASALQVFPIQFDDLFEVVETASA